VELTKLEQDDCRKVNMLQVLLADVLGLEANADLLEPVVYSFNVGVRSAGANFIFDLLNIIEEFDVWEGDTKVAVIVVVGYKVPTEFSRYDAPVDENLCEFLPASMLVDESFGQSGAEIAKAPDVGSGWSDSGEVVTKFTERFIKQRGWHRMFLRATTQNGCVLALLSNMEIVWLSL